MLIVIVKCAVDLKYCFKLKVKNHIYIYFITYFRIRDYIDYHWEMQDHCVIL